MVGKKSNLALCALLSVTMLTPVSRASADGTGTAAATAVSASDFTTRTPIKHLVVIYQENVSFDHYFGTYPRATNPKGEPAFTAKVGTPTAVYTLRTSHLLSQNPNTGAQNGTGAALPFRLDRTQASSADQNHAYTAEQMAYDNGKADLFPLYTGKGTPGGVGAFGTSGQVMGYYDGNTVTALWRYAQRFAMNDNAYTDVYGPSTPGALNVVSGQTNGMVIVATTKQPSTQSTPSAFVEDGQGGYTMINDIDPAYDACSSKTDQVLMSGQNIGDLLNASGITWGGFMGGFDLRTSNDNGSNGCTRYSYSTVVAQNVVDYIPHHNWFQYYKSTSNPMHARPDSIASVGYTTIPGKNKADPANHEYDIDDFYKAVKRDNFPAVSFIKMPAYQDGHAGYSDPLDEQAGIVRLVNFLQKTPEWKDTAIVITYDDSDGWYDHLYATPTHGSFAGTADQVNGAGVCGETGNVPQGVNGQPVNGRCGPGTRIPLIVISPWAKTNHISHNLVTQSSVVRFIEDNWLHGKRIGGGSFDATAGKLDSLFDFTTAPRTEELLLDTATGNVRYDGMAN
ncbi:phospholipase C [Gluconacetobacter tumulisoli]|uniref:Alkaline phosphatase family protein n=1 Tax=Gluconacetobacter tumulisoli TaxID=1286189 RepID=A0A7W4K6U0_9PROT|nr:alkaline phosphatase family protein [Gluconacetobacter tumulisoli]MBB2201447.1 alkaline phosphatase family protein [Gluconacetobacter tumulisoli]